MKPLKIALVVILLSTALVLFHDYWVGVSLQPVLEKQLAEAFNMPFNIDGLRVRLWPPGKIYFRKIECLNPKEFKRREHFAGEEVTFWIDLKTLRQKCIRIKKAHFKKFLFAVETHMTGGETHTNTYVWYHHMGLDEEDSPSMNFPKSDTPSLDEAVAAATAKGKWRVMIDRLELEDGTFLFDDRRIPGGERHWLFKNLKGFWEGFDFISGYTSPSFREYIKLEGTFGKNPPARFKGEGKCQFADGNNFDIHASITGGGIAEYDFLLEGLPGEVKGGAFDLVSHLLCLESDLKSEHVLTLRSMKLSTPTMAQKLLKYPFGTVLWALENQKSIELEVNVNGYIGDPKFHFFPAFTKAFQKALAYKAKAILSELKKGTSRVATAAPAQVRNGVGQIGNFLNSAFNTLNPLTLPGEIENGKNEEPA